MRLILVVCISNKSQIVLLYGCTSLFIQSSSEGHLGYFQFWAIMNKVTLNTYIEAFCVNIKFHFCKYLGEGLLCYNSKHMTNCRWNCQMFCHPKWLHCYFHQPCMGVLAILHFLHHLIFSDFNLKKFLCHFNRWYSLLKFSLIGCMMKVHHSLSSNYTSRKWP